MKTKQAHNHRGNIQRHCDANMLHSTSFSHIICIYSFSVVQIYPCDDCWQFSQSWL